MWHASAKLTITAAFIGIFTWGAFAQDVDPPARVARLNYLNGNVSMEPAGSDDWGPAAVNQPLTTGDYLYTDNDAQAELHMDIAVLRAAPLTSFGFLNLNDQIVQMKLSEGEMYIRVHNFGTGQVFEVDTPNAAITLLRDGVYRFNVDPNGNTSYIVVRQGSAEVTGGGQAFTLNPGNGVNLSGTDQLAYDVENAPALDPFESWSQQRDQHEMRPRQTYVPPSVIGYEDLDDYGSWSSTPDYGPVWYPTTVVAGWAPYHYGHWAWVEPWGYTWVDSAPWGFAPFHYGRWAYIHNRWGWCPGPIAVGYRGPAVAAVRPYYAPALVTFFGGAHFGGISIGVNIGSVGASLGWCPLGFGEVYAPPYHVSQRYFQNVNIANTRIDRNVNITNIYNTTYVNRTVVNNYNGHFVNMNAPGGFSTMNRNAFASGELVHRAGFIVPPAQAERLARTGGPVVGPPVAPMRQAFAPGVSGGRIARPAPQVMTRQVVARNAPPPSAPSFAARQAYLQQHAGQPLNVQLMHREAARANPAVASRQPVLVRQAPAVARPVQAKVGQRVGNPVPFHGPQHPGNVPPTNAPAANNRPGPQQPTAGRSPQGLPLNQRHENPTQNNPGARPGGPSPNNEHAQPAHANQQQRPNVRPAPSPQAPQQQPQHNLPPNQHPMNAGHPQTAPAHPLEHPQPAPRQAPTAPRPAQQPHAQPRQPAAPQHPEQPHGTPPSQHHEPQHQEHQQHPATQEHHPAPPKEHDRAPK